MAKQAKYESTGGVDGIGSLPDDILCYILSFLPTKCAVRTSILSPRWRYLFASSISTLDIHHCLRSVPFENVEMVNSFLNFVDRFFSNPKQVSLECFRLNDRWINYDDLWENDYDRINGWLCAALRLGVKKLDLHLMDWLSDALQLGVKRFDIRVVDSLPDALQHGVKKLDIRSITRIASFSLPTHLFTCQSLVALELKMMICYINDPINNISLPNLKTLHFEKSDFLNGSSVRRLISSCPALEEMALIDCEFHNINELKIDTLSLKRLVLVLNFNAIVIHAPSLVYLKYVTKKGGGYTLGSMKHLETARIEICIDDVVEWLLGPRATNLLQGICHVKSLYLNTKQAEKLIRMPRESLLPFHNLIKLEIASLNEDVQGTWVIEFLHCVPNLKTLDLAPLKVAANGGVEPLSKDVPSCLLFHIEEITISYSNRDEDIEMISYFLHHATFLEKLMIYMSIMKPKGLSEITKKFLDLPRKSKKCRVVIL